MSGTLSQAQEKWLDGLVPGLDGKMGPVVQQGDAAKARAKLRAEVLGQVLADVEKLKPALLKHLKDYKIERNGKIIPLHDDSLNPDNSVSVGSDLRSDDTGSAKIVGDARSIIEGLRKTREVLVQKQEILRTARMNAQFALSTDGTGEPLFTERDIQDELWTPLVREGIMPEDQVIDRFSEMAQLFQGATDSYAERLDIFTEAEDDPPGDLSELLGTASGVVEKVEKYTKLVGDLVPELSDKVVDRKWVEGLKESTANALLLMQATSTGLKLGQAVLDRKDGDSIADLVGKAVAPVAGLLPVPDEFKEIFPKTVNALLGAGKFGAFLWQGQYEKAATALADSIGDALEAIGKTRNDEQVTNAAGRVKGGIRSLTAGVVLLSKRGSARDEIYGAWESLAKEVGDVVLNEIKLLKQANTESKLEEERKLIIERLKPKLTLARDVIETVSDICLGVPDLSALKGDKGGLDKALENEVNDCAVAIEKLAATYEALRKEITPDQIGPLSEALQRQVEEVQRKAESVTAMSKEVNEALQKAYRNKDERTRQDDEEEEEEEEPSDTGGWDRAETLAKLKAARKGMFPAESMLEDLEAQALTTTAQTEREEFARALREDIASDTDDPGTTARLDLQKIDALIDRLKADKAWFKMGNTIADLGVKAGTLWLEQLGPLATVKDLLLNVHSAYERADEYRVWAQAAQESGNAAAHGLAAAQLNRVGIVAKDLKQDRIKAVLKTCQLVGETLKLTGVATLFGTTVSVAAQGTDITREWMTSIFSAKDMEKAWDAYQRALLNPGDRKAQRQALRSNATLAKYALAWAAMEGGNPLAKDLMRQCGLTDAVLADKDTDAQKVVRYLEMKFDSDPIVLRSTPKKQEWWPADPALTARSWNSFSVAAAKLTPALDANPTVLVTKAFVGMEKALAAAEQDRADLPAQAAAAKAVQAVRQALQAYRPVDVEGRQHAAMQAYVDVVAAKAELLARTLPPVTN